MVDFLKNVGLWEKVWQWQQLQLWNKKCEGTYPKLNVLHSLEFLHQRRDNYWHVILSVNMVRSSKLLQPCVRLIKSESVVCIIENVEFESRLLCWRILFVLVCFLIGQTVVDIRYQGVLDGTIGLVMKKRRVRSQIEGLTEQDLFFREVCSKL